MASSLERTWCLITQGKSEIRREVSAERKIAADRCDDGLDSRSRTGVPDICWGWRLEKGRRAAGSWLERKRKRGCVDVVSFRFLGFLILSL